MGDLGSLLQQLGTQPHERGRQFERLCQWFLRNDRFYGHELANVWLWDEWPGRFGADAGIDLVAETHGGELWAVQAKAYDSRYSVTKADVDSFLSESGRPAFSFRLLIATTNLIGRRAEKTLTEQAVPAGILRLSQLERAEVDWPNRVGDLRPRRAAPKLPRRHSTEAIEAVCAGFASHDRGQLVMACGTGKTLVGLWVSERLNCERTLVLVPSLSLLAQTLREWAGSASSPFSSLAVCSDPSVEGDQDQVVEHTAELAFPPTTDPTMIAAALARSGRHVTFATYQSSQRIADAQRLGAPPFDVVIADEAHRCAGRTDVAFSLVLDSRAINAHRRLFMTATPRYFTDRVHREAGDIDAEVASMDDEDRFGPVFHRLGFSEAIERDLLSDYQVVVVGVDDDKCRDVAVRGALVVAEGLGETDARTLAAQIGVARAMKDYDLHRVVTFHSRVSAARRFARDLPATLEWMPEDERPMGRLWAQHVSGEMPAGARDVALARLRAVLSGERGVLSNARCLAEGVDVPAIDGVVFVDPRRSIIDVTQAVGRAIRKSEDKTKGTVVLPVFIDTTRDPNEAISSSAFAPVWEVIRALRAHDDELAEWLDAMRRQLGRRVTGEFRLPARLRLDFPQGVDEAFARAFTVRLVEHTTMSWEQSFGTLQDFIEREGHARVPTPHIENGIPLGRWVTKQRTNQSVGQIAPDRVQRLEALRGWVWDAYDADWQAGLGCLRRFVAREGHALVPQGHTEDGFSLGTWVNTQRSAHRRGRLNADRARELATVAGWVWDAPSAQWERCFAALMHYASATGSSDVSIDAVFEGTDVGQWVRAQRSAHRSGRLAPERAQLLEALPHWSWTVQEDAWERGIAALQSFVAREGHARVPQGHVEEGVRLGSWVAEQRNNRRDQRLDSVRTGRLEAEPGWTWDALVTAWEDGFTHLVAFAEAEGHTNIETGYVTDDRFRLGQWVMVQRSWHKSGRLDPDRALRLDELPGWTWDRRADQWNEGFERLSRFVEREGHARVPAKHIEEGFRLGSWVNKMRTRFKEAGLDDERVARLESVPGWTWDVLTAAWEEGFSHLGAFVKRIGHAQVPQAHVEEGFRLGQWVAVQRTRHKEGRLADERADRLSSLPGWSWSPRGTREASTHPD